MGAISFAAPGQGKLTGADTWPMRHEAARRDGEVEDSVHGSTGPHMTALAEVSDLDLTDLAAGGDRAAAGEVISRRLPMLTAMARRYSSPGVDPDDLVADAIVKLLEKWSTGQGPRHGVTSYLLRTMQNRAVDELRSPRSRGVSIDVIAEPFDDEPIEFHRAELHEEFALVREALSRLTLPQRQVLQATVIDGRKPGDLVTEMKRPAGAVYAMAHRARVALQRSLLQVILEEDAPVECRRCAKALPRVVTADLLDETTSTASRHITECDACSRRWRRYLMLLESGGIASLVVVATALFTPPQPAVAAEPASEQETQRPTPRPGGTATRIALQAGATFRNMGIVGVAAGLVLVLVAFFVPFTRAPQSSPTPAATLAVHAVSTSPGQTLVNVSFSVASASWRIESAHFTIPAGTTLGGFPVGWSCSQAGDDVECVTEEVDPRGGDFVFTNQGTSTATYEMVIHARSGNVPITATAQGPFPR